MGTNGKLIIHIQDAHSNYSGQMSLAKALDFFMKKYGITLVLTEGADRDVTLTEAKGITDQETWKIVAKRYLQDGLINGSEYLNLATTNSMKIRGVEYMDLYDKSLKTYSDLVDERKKILIYLHQIHAIIDRLKAKLYPDTLMDYEKKKSSDEGANFSTTATELFAVADKAQISLEGFAEIVKLREIQKKEKTLNFASVNSGLEKLLSELRANGRKEDAENYLTASKKIRNQQISQGHLLKDLVNTAKGQRINIPAELADYSAYLDSFNELQMDQLLQEMEQAEDTVFKALLPDEDQRRLRAVDRFVELLDKAYRIKMSSQDFKTYLANEEDFKTQGWEAFLNGKLIDFKYFDDLLPFKTYFEDAAKFLKNFYALADQRDEAFLENTNKIMTEEKAQAAYLVTGGYHTEHLTELLRNEGYSYVVLTPFVEYETDQNLYEKVLLKPLELAKNNQVSGASATQSAEKRDSKDTLMAIAARLAVGKGARFEGMVMGVDGAAVTKAVLAIDAGNPNVPPAGSRMSSLVPGKGPELNETFRQLIKDLEVIRKDDVSGMNSWLTRVQDAILKFYEDPKSQEHYLIDRVREFHLKKRGVEAKEISQHPEYLDYMRDITAVIRVQLARELIRFEYLEEEEANALLAGSRMASHQLGMSDEIIASMRQAIIEPAETPSRIEIKPEWFGDLYDNSELLKGLVELTKQQLSNDRFSQAKFELDLRSFLQDLHPQQRRDFDQISAVTFRARLLYDLSKEMKLYGPDIRTPKTLLDRYRRTPDVTYAPKALALFTEDEIIPEIEITLNMLGGDKGFDFENSFGFGDSEAFHAMAIRLLLKAEKDRQSDYVESWTRYMNILEKVGASSSDLQLLMNIGANNIHKIDPNALYKIYNWHRIFANILVKLVEVGNPVEATSIEAWAVQLKADLAANHANVASIATPFVERIISKAQAKLAGSKMTQPITSETLLLKGDLVYGYTARFQETNNELYHHLVVDSESAECSDLSGGKFLAHWADAAGKRTSITDAYLVSDLFRPSSSFERTTLATADQITLSEATPDELEYLIAENGRQLRRYLTDPLQIEKRAEQPILAMRNGRKNYGSLVPAILGQDARSQARVLLHELTIAYRIRWGGISSSPGKDGVNYLKLVREVSAAIKAGDIVQKLTTLSGSPVVVMADTERGAELYVGYIEGAPNYGVGSVTLTVKTMDAGSSSSRVAIVRASDITLVQLTDSFRPTDPTQQYRLFLGTMSNASNQTSPSYIGRATFTAAKLYINHSNGPQVEIALPAPSIIQAGSRMATLNAEQIQIIQGFFDADVNQNDQRQNNGRLDPAGKIMQFEIAVTDKPLDLVDSRNGLGYSSTIKPQDNKVVYRYEINPAQLTDGSQVLDLIRRDLKPTRTNNQWKSEDFDSYLAPRWSDMILQVTAARVIAVDESAKESTATENIDLGDGNTVPLKRVLAMSAVLTDILFEPDMVNFDNLRNIARDSGFEPEDPPAFWDFVHRHTRLGVAGSQNVMDDTTKAIMRFLISGNNFYDAGVMDENGIREFVEKNRANQKTNALVKPLVGLATGTEITGAYKPYGNADTASFTGTFLELGTEYIRVKLDSGGGTLLLYYQGPNAPYGNTLISVRLAQAGSRLTMITRFLRELGLNGFVGEVVALDGQRIAVPEALLAQLSPNHENTLEALRNSQQTITGLFIPGATTESLIVPTGQQEPVTMQSLPEIGELVRLWEQSIRHSAQGMSGTQKIVFGLSRSMSYPGLDQMASQISASVLKASDGHIQFTIQRFERSIDELKVDGANIVVMDLLAHVGVIRAQAMQLNDGNMGIIAAQESSLGLPDLATAILYTIEGVTGGPGGVSDLVDSRVGRKVLGGASVSERPLLARGNLFSVADQATVLLVASHPLLARMDGAQAVQILSLIMAGMSA